jgi:hypothetical protein
MAHYSAYSSDELWGDIKLHAKAVAALPSRLVGLQTLVEILAAVPAARKLSSNVKADWRCMDSCMKH